MRIQVTGGSQVTNLFVEEEEKIDQLVASEAIVQGSPNQDAIKKDYNDANAIALELQKQIDEDNTKMNALIQQMRSLRKDIGNLQQQVNSLPEGPQKEAAKAALKRAEVAFG